METMSAREAAFRILSAYRRGKARPGASLDRLISESGMPAVDAALTTRLVYGILQNLAYCDYIAAHYSSMNLKKLEPGVLDILRISIYQIAFLTKIPHSAIVNESVALAKKHSNPRAAGFVNAVLRSMTAGGLPEISADNESQYLSIKYSHPEWLVRELCAALGRSSAEAFLAMNNEPAAPVTAQVNVLRSNTEAALRALATDGVAAAGHEWLDDCVELHSPGGIGRLSAIKEGLIYIQDAASRLAVEAARPEQGNFVIDGCSAPGGKSFTSAIMMRNEGAVSAFDLSARKLRTVSEGAERLGIDIISVSEKDAAAPDIEFAGKADVVLADVPCSGFGVIRKKPEIRYKTQDEISGLPDLQERILTGLSKYVRPGGTLLYSTCSIFRRENEDVVDSYLEKNRDFSLEGFSLPGVGEAPGGMITLWPHIHGTDGFFICKLKREYYSRVAQIQPETGA